MVAWKNLLVLWGGFQDTSLSTKYLGDLWVFDIDNYTWTPIALAAHAQRPDPRSSFSFLPTDTGAVLFGGYSKQKVAAQSQGRRAGPSKNTTTEVGVIHDDTWILRLDTDLTKIRWERRKKPANAPNPKRVGVTMAHHKGRGIMFGGVWDATETDESLESVFFNELFAWSTDRNRFFPLVLRKPRQQKRAAAGEGQRGNRRDRAREDEEELLRNLARLEAEAAGKSSAEIEAAEQAAKEKEEAERRAMLEKQELSLELPSPRFHTALAVHDDVLYIYGGTVEKGDQELVYDEMYAIDLGKLDGVRTVFYRKVETDWVDSESEDDEDDEDEEDDEEDEEEENAAAEAANEKKPKISEEELERRREEKAKVYFRFPSSSYSILTPCSAKKPKPQPQPPLKRPNRNPKIPPPQPPTRVPSSPSASSTLAHPTNGRTMLSHCLSSTTFSSVKSRNRKRSRKSDMMRSRRLRRSGGIVERRSEHSRMNRKRRALERLLVWRIARRRREAGRRGGNMGERAGRGNNWELMKVV